MSQFKFNIANTQMPLDAFATIAVASTVGYLVGEAVYQGASLAAATASAKVSGIVDSTHLRVKSVKGAWANTTAVVGNKSTTSSAAAGAGAFTWGITRLRDVGTGTPTAKTFGALTLDDMGVHVKVRDDVSNSEFMTVAARMALSKTQNTDTSVAPTLVYTLPADGTYANGAVMTFIIDSNEALVLSGANFPRVAIATLGSAETVYASYVPGKSDSMHLVFEYVLDTATTTAGQIVSATYNNNTSAVITDVGGAAVVPSSFGDVTGIILA